MKLKMTLIGIAVAQDSQCAKNNILRKEEANGDITMFGDCSHVCDRLPQALKDDIYSLCDTFRKEQKTIPKAKFCETLDFADGKSYCRVGNESCFLTNRQFIDWSGCADVYAICEAENSDFSI